MSRALQLIAGIESIVVWLDTCGDAVDADAFTSEARGCLAAACEIAGIPCGAGLASLEGFAALDAAASILVMLHPDRARELPGELLIAADHARHLPGAAALTARIDKR